VDLIDNRGNFKYRRIHSLVVNEHILDYLLNDRIELKVKGVGGIE